MKSFQKTESKVIALPLNDIDTDMLIPAQYMTSTSKDGYGEFLFDRLRKADPEFPLNLPKFQEAEIILAKKNFGCGSSREHAVWALMSWGIKVVIAESFADIFFSNSSKNGLVTIILPSEKIQKLFELLEEDDEAKIQVNLENKKIILPSLEEFDFEYDEFRRECILNGEDDLDYLLKFENQIDDWDQKRSKNVYLKV
jgi:3-isopropylmalate/(R)-2-methylmalate dehydratase small subunit